MPGEEAGGGAQAPSGPAPQLPDAVPQGVQDLLNGVFGGIDAVGRGFGEAVSGLAGAIGDALGGGSATIVAYLPEVAALL